MGPAKACFLACTRETGGMLVAFLRYPAFEMHSSWTSNSRVGHRLLPIVVHNVGLVHHVIPFACPMLEVNVIPALALRMVLTIKQLVVLRLESIVLLKERLDIVSELVRTETSLGCTQSIDSRRDPHLCQGVGSLHWVMYKLEKSCFLVRGERIVDGRGQAVKVLQVGQDVVRPDTGFLAATTVRS